MTTGAVWSLSARNIAARVAADPAFAAEAVNAGWKSRGSLFEPRVHAVVHEDAGRRAEAAAAPHSGPLAGVPVLVKDNLCTTDYPTTCASHILADYRPPYDATVIRRLREAGAIVIGKANMDEFAMGSSTEHSCYGPTRNPYDLDRVPGGSSGGSAAAVAYGLCPVALGSDTGGSVRQPAAFCGVFGLKPTYGRLSRYGLVAFGSSLDQVGVFARNTGDVATTYAALAGPDPYDATTRLSETPDVSRWDAGVDGMKFGWPEALWREGVDAEVLQGLDEAAANLERAGAVRVPLELIGGETAVACYYVIATAEASSNLARFDGVRYGRRNEAADDLLDLYTRSRSEGFGEEVQRRILLGTYALSSGYYDAYYLTAQRARTLIRRSYERAFEACDFILMPAAPTLPFRLGEKARDPISMYLSDIFTLGANLAGIPGLTVPVSPTASGLPRAAQVVGPVDSEPTLLRAGRAIEVCGERDRLGAEHEVEFAWPGNP